MSRKANYRIQRGEWESLLLFKFTSEMSQFVILEFYLFFSIPILKLLNIVYTSIEFFLGDRLVHFTKIAFSFAFLFVQYKGMNKPLGEVLDPGFWNVYLWNRIESRHFLFRFVMFFKVLRGLWWQSAEKISKMVPRVNKGFHICIKNSSIAIISSVNLLWFSTSTLVSPGTKSIISRKSV